jgi:hypothetical protein
LRQKGDELASLNKAGARLGPMDQPQHVRQANQGGLATQTVCLRSYLLRLALRAQPRSARFVTGRGWVQWTSRSTSARQTNVGWQLKRSASNRTCCGWPCGHSRAPPDL